MTKKLMIAALALVAATGMASAQDKLNDLEIAHAAYTADVIDIRYAHIALAISDTPAIRKFAEAMISDHTAVNEGAGALLKKLNAAPQDNAFSQALLKGAAEKQAELLSLRGDAFDKAYASNELGYHQTVNKILGETWLPIVDNAELKEFLAEALVTFKAHEAHAGLIAKMAK